MCLPSICHYDGQQVQFCLLRANFQDLVDLNHGVCCQILKQLGWLCLEFCWDSCVLLRAKESRPLFLFNREERAHHKTPDLIKVSTRCVSLSHNHWRFAVCERKTWNCSKSLGETCALIATSLDLRAQRSYWASRDRACYVTWSSAWAGAVSRDPASPNTSSGW